MQLNVNRLAIRLIIYSCVCLKKFNDHQAPKMENINFRQADKTIKDYKIGLR